MSLAYGDTASFVDVTPRVGKSAMGRSAVTPSGIASVSHQMDIQARMPSTWRADGGRLSGATSDSRR